MTQFGAATPPQPNKKKIANRQARQRDQGSIAEAIRSSGQGVDLLRARQEDIKRRQGMM